MSSSCRNVSIFDTEAGLGSGAPPVYIKYYLSLGFVDAAFDLWSNRDRHFGFSQLLLITSWFCAKHSSGWHKPSLDLPTGVSKETFVVTDFMPVCYLADVQRVTPGVIFHLLLSLRLYVIASDLHLFGSVLCKLTVYLSV